MGWKLVGFGCVEVFVCRRKHRVGRRAAEKILVPEEKRREERRRSAGDASPSQKCPHQASFLQAEC